MKRLSIWDKDGRELVCCPVDEDHVIRDSRMGFRSKVVTTDGEHGYSHIYYDGTPFHAGRERSRACIFYQKNTWWRSHIHIKGWIISFTPPRERILKSELTVLAARILEINQELTTL